ncbi:MAG: MBL fold metallo-hydrolase [Candidatus Thiodiazotropha sp. (ex. Lucinisca nassula)]|nr:MBL fold metallo-hydrolase [Candidatus Thiodiazotropha sp. (ex. Lucinisca nassula)]
MNPADEQIPDYSALSLRFLGVGNAQAAELGASAAVLENHAEPILLIDCGPDTLSRFRQIYGELEPSALFITHAHFDHIGGLEGWFYRLMTNNIDRKPKLYIPVKLLPVLQRRIADYPNFMAEGGCNFWEAFQLIPVSERFWLNDLLFDLFLVRHHEYDTAFGLALKGHFLFTGDTLPIPEVLIRFASHGELIFHDCTVEESPSHTSLSEIKRTYRREQWRRMIFYHYASLSDRKLIEATGLQVAIPEQSYPLSPARKPYSHLQIGCIHSEQHDKSELN